MNCDTRMSGAFFSAVAMTLFGGVAMKVFFVILFKVE